MSEKKIKEIKETDGLVPLEERAKKSDPEVSGKNAKSKKAKPKKEKKSFGRKIKEIFSELKKVTWPTFPQILKGTGVVIIVVLFFLIVLGVFDGFLAFLMKLLVGE